MCGKTKQQEQQTHTQQKQLNENGYAKISITTVILQGFWRK